MAKLRVGIAALAGQIRLMGRVEKIAPASGIAVSAESPRRLSSSFIWIGRFVDMGPMRATDIRVLDADQAVALGPDDDPGQPVVLGVVADQAEDVIGAEHALLKALWLPVIAP